MRERSSSGSSTLGGSKATVSHAKEGFSDECPRCGARRVDRQLGLEPTPDEYVARIVEVFREVRRVLADHGTCWVNLGDSYAHSTDRMPLQRGLLDDGAARFSGQTSERLHGLKPKDLVGIPWRVAFALQADGWYLRSDIIWAKPNPMPESVTDRPTKAHEYVFLLTKKPRYFFDQEAVRELHADTIWGRASTTSLAVESRPGEREGRMWENRRREYNPAGRKASTVWRIDEEQKTLDPELPPETPRGPDGRRKTTVTGRDGSVQHRDGERWPNGGRNIRSVWEIATQPYPEAHFATYPEELVRRCVLAGCPLNVCRVCGKARERIVESRRNGGDWNANNRVGGDRMRVGQSASDRMPLNYIAPMTIGWSDCGHNDYRPGVVLDPFLGSGTTALVARKHGRSSVGIELSESYCELAGKRLQQLSLLASE